MLLPKALISSLQNVKGFAQQGFEETHHLCEQVVSIRINANKLTNEALPILEKPYNKIPWCTNGYYLNHRPSFTLDPLLHAGAYYVQEASSMFLEQALRQSVHLEQPIKILDLCAAPGGKSTLIQSLINSNSLLVSNEVIKTRANILVENLTKWGGANVVVTNNDPKDFKRLPQFFDVIVIDAPCSGSGLFRKDELAINEWSENNVTLCSQRQQRILADILPALKPNGIIIYSTCSYSTQENEAIATWFTNTNNFTSIPLKIDPNWQIIETNENNIYGYRFYPNLLKGEGFFITVFKNNEPNFVKTKLEKPNFELLKKNEIEILKPFIHAIENYFFIKQKDEIIALPIQFQNSLATIQANLYIKKAGIKIGCLIRGELIPDHSLAVSNILNKEIKSVELDNENALQYLRKANVTIQTNQLGWVLVTYLHQPLGWIKALPNRTNNYYPKEWRILKP